MRAILIDAVNRQVREVEYTGNLDDAYHLIGCEIVEAVNIENDDCIYVDEEGLLKPAPNWFLFEGYAQPLAGSGLVVGTNMRTGETVACKATVPDIYSRVKFMNYGEVKEWAAEHG